MIILHLSQEYDNPAWIEKWFKRDLCICRFDNFPKSEISQRSWVGIHIKSTIRFIGKLDDAKQVLNSRNYRIYLKTLIGFRPIEYLIKNRKDQYDFVHIDDYHNHGKHVISIGKDKTVVPIFPKM